MTCYFKKEKHEGIIIPVLLDLGDKLKDKPIQDIINKIKNESTKYIKFSENNQDLIQSIQDIARELNYELNENSIKEFTEESSKAITPVKTTDIKSESDPAKSGSSDVSSLAQQLRAGSEARIVNTNAEIKTNADVLDKFKTSTTLYDRYVSKLGKDLFRIAFIDFNEGTITLNNTELNAKMDEYKIQLFNDIKKYVNLDNKQAITLYNNNEFNLKGYNEVIEDFKRQISNSESTTKELEEINANINNLTPEQQSFLNAYNAYITLTNLDAVIGLYYNDLLQLQKPEYKHVINVPKGTSKYAAKIENKLDQHFRINEDSNIEKETTALTKAIINNIPRLNQDGIWDGHSYLEVNDVNTLFTFLQKPELLLIYDTLRTSLLHPEDSYVEFFKSILSDTRYNIINVLERNGMNKQQLDTLCSIAETIFNTKEGKNSLYNIMIKNQFRAPLNYFSDLIAYFNKQAPSSYTSYSYDPETKSFVTRNLTQNAFEKSRALHEGSATLASNRASLSINDESTYVGKMFSGNNPGGTTIIYGSTKTNSNDANITYKVVDSIKIGAKQFTNTREGREKLIDDADALNQVLSDLTAITGIPFKDNTFRNELDSRYYHNHSAWELQACEMYFDLLNKINIVNAVRKVYGKEAKCKDYDITILKNRIFSTLQKEGLIDSNVLPKNANKYFSTRTDKLLVMYSGSDNKYPLFIEIVYAYNALENKANPSNVKDTNKNSLPAVGLINLTKTFLTHVEAYKSNIQFLKTKNPDYHTVGSDNIFYNTRNNPFRGITYKSEFVSSDGTAILKNKFNVNEYFSTAFLLDYLYNLYNDSAKTVSFLPTVYADKSTQSLIQIDKNTQCINGDKTIKTATASDIENTYKDKQKSYYNDVCYNIILDYKTLIEHANANGANIKVDFNVFNSNISNNIASWINEINNILSIEGNFTKLAQASKTANVRFISETHYSNIVLPTSNDKAVPQFNPFIANMWAMFNESTKNKINDIPHISYNEFQKANIERFCGHIDTTKIKIDTILFPFINSALGNAESEWISPEKYLILYKRDNKGNIVLNPLLKKFFYLDGFISTQFMQMTGGEPYTHPSKLFSVFDASNPVEYLQKDHAKRLVAQYKRMVIQQATFHPLMQNTRTGVPDTYNVANYKDRKGKFITLTGGTYNQDVLDGSAECPGWVNIWENNSLMSSSAGDNKKNISHNLDPVTGAPLLLKYALFAINNNRVRSSMNATYDRKEMIRKGSLQWPSNVILGKDFLGNTLNLSQVFNQDLYYYDVKDGKDYMITNLEYSRTIEGKNYYTVSYKPVTIENGLINKKAPILKKEVPINSNYDLWQALGGEFSKELIGNTIKQDLDWSENSMKAVAAYGNVTGILRCKETNKYLPKNYQSDLNLEDIVKGDFNEGDDNYTITNGEYKVLLTQSHVYLPLKHSDIHYHAQISSTKCGPSNINASETLKLGNDESINFFEMKMPYNGIQMDADHYADRGEVTEATQVISTLAANGKTSDIAEQVYNTIGVIVRATLNDYLKGIKNSGIINYKGDIDSSLSSNKDKVAFTKALGKAVINLFTNDSSKQTILQGYLNKAAKQLDSEFAEIFKEYNIPYSANAIYGKFLTNFTSRMNSDCIKRKMPGLADIMIPSHGAVQFYNITLDNSRAIANLFQDNPNLNFLVGRVSYLKILTTLAPLINARGGIADKSGLHLFGKEAVDYILKKISLNNRVSTDDIEFYDTVQYDNGDVVYIDDYNKLRQVRSQHSSIFRQVKSKDLLPFDATFEANILINGTSYQRKYSIYDLKSTKNIFDVTANKNSTREDFLKAKKALDDVLTSLESDGEILVSELLDNYDDNSGDVVKIKNLTKKPAQVVLSNVYARTYGLKKGDNISDIINNPDFFTKRLSALYDNATKVDPKSDFVLISADGNNAYVRCITSDKEEAAAEAIEGLQEVYIDTEKDDDGNTWRIDSNGNKLYKVDGIKFYVDSNSREYIVVDYDAYPKNIVEKIEAIRKADDFMDIIYNPLDIAVGDFHTNLAILEEYINRYDESVLNSFGKTTEDFSISTLNKYTLSQHIDDLKTWQIQTRGNQMWNSFKETLKVTANRIPAQTFQSIMTMEVVGFSESDANEVYVSAIQLILQGSDYDIDKAYTMVTPVDRNGIMRGWSPIFDCSSPKNLEASKKLPFPNYDIKDIEVINSDVDSDTSEEEEDVLELDSSIIEKASNKDYAKEDGEIILKSKALQLEFAAFILNTIEKHKDDTEDGYLIYDLNKIKVSNKIRLYNNFNGTWEDYTIKLEPVINLIKRHLKKPSSNRTLISMAKAFNYNSIYTISNSLKNAVASQSPIEIRAPKEVAKKSTLGKYGETVSNFDPMVKYNFFFENMAGKDVIGIMAVAQKIFLATSQMLNMKVKKLQKLYEDKGEEAVIEELRNSKIINNNNFLYKYFTDNEGNLNVHKIKASTVANINWDEASNVYDIVKNLVETYDGINSNSIDVLKASVDTFFTQYPEDISLLISELLSAATDNAKELVLSKINCGPDMAGIWAYFIINGFDMHDIGELMISDVVNTISTLSRADRLQGNHVSINSIIRDIEKGDTNWNNYFPYTWFSSIFKIINEIAKNKKIKIPKTAKAKTTSISKLAQIKALPIEDLNTIIEELKSKSDSDVIIGRTYHGYEDDGGMTIRDENGKAKLLRYLEDLVLYKSLNADYIPKPEMRKTKEQCLFENFSHAVKAADELTIAGQLLGINQGIKTDLEGRLKFLHNFDKMFSRIKYMLSDILSATTEYREQDNRAIREAYILFKDILPYSTDFNVENPELFQYEQAYYALKRAFPFNSSSFNLHRFLQEPTYKEAIIRTYSTIQYTINPFELVSEMANYNSFLEVFDTNEIIFKLASVKYSLFNTIRNKLSEEYKQGTSLNDNDITKINNYIDEVLIQKWFKSLGAKSEFQLKKGWKYFDESGNLVEAHDNNTTINLNNIHGIASFKYMMDNYIIPSLKQGIVINASFNEITDSNISNNDFIKNLKVTDREDVLTNENYEYYKLDMDIMNTENNPNYDKALSGFTNVSSVKMIGHSLVDLFSIYTLIVHKGRMGQDSLLRLFQGAIFNDSNIINDYYNFIGNIDINTTGENLNYIANINDTFKVTEDDISLDDILIELSPIEGTYEAYQAQNSYSRDLNKKTETYIIYKKDTDENNKTSKTEIILPGSDSNYYLFRNYNDSYIKPNEVVATEADNTIDITDTEFKKLILDAIANLKMTYDIKCTQLL